MARGPASQRAHAQATEPPSSLPDTKASKRRCVQSACVPCRKRKSKCDGGTPVCATCTAVYKTDCHYDTDSESKRPRTGSTATSTTTSTTTTTSAPGRRESSTAAVRASNAPGSASPTSNGSNSNSSSSSEHAEFIVASLRSLPESEVFQVLQHIRRDARLDLAALADSLRRTVTLPPSASAGTPGLEADLSVLLGKPAMTQTGESFGHTSSLGLVAEDENYTRSRPPASRTAEPRTQTWTAVSHDLAFVERLLDLYFRWSHAFYVIFSRECFYNDFRSGRSKYCSSLLVNAILAYACHFSDEPQGRTDPANARTAGDLFFAEARRLLHEDETPSLTTTQALCVLAMREPSAGRDSSGFMYSGRCMRMAVELGLHLSYTATAALGLTASEIEVRKVTFWGCFTVDTVWSTAVGRISQLPRAAITLEKPMIEESIHGPHADAYSGTPQLPPGMITSRVFLQEFGALSELVNDNNCMFFAPKERFTSRKLLDCYYRYQAWHKALPTQMRLDCGTTPQPHIIVLHMLYYNTIVLLFRPLLKVELIHSDIRPRDICIQSANKVTELLRLYRSYYNLRACPLVLTHILLSVSIVHLAYSTEIHASRRNLIECLTALEDSSTCHHFGARSFKVVYALARMWKLPWPDELQHSRLIAGWISPLAERFDVPHTTGTTSRLGGGSTGYSPTLPSSHGVRRESLGMFAADRSSLGPPSHPASASGSSIDGRLSQQQPQHMTSTSTTTPLPYHAASTPSTITNTLPTTPATPASDSAAETLFWAPVPGMGMPILHRAAAPLSPMDIHNIMGNVDEWDRFGRDGFKISEAWPQDPLNSFNAGTQGGQHNAHAGAGGVGATAESQVFGHHGEAGFQAGDASAGFAQAGQGQEGVGGYEAWWPHASSGVVEG
ncbi:fungal-specific transcription factor domain-containing protein [Massariosphaeria phaeospora]|uniref:Fungal-specific transcription factor domain-containing protein n=1 Tax=Massariosphaeria phaeospora TaxID=100035 RepID=A0A7C8I6Y7_9PLEO|nr:fungal-specific transcription factor domain-containing protein [Massariosphaeria phaeospora]